MYIANISRPVACHNPFRSFHAQLTFHRVSRGESAAFQPSDAQLENERKGLMRKH